ncbi:MAG TPA: hypothetical protein VKZ79_19475 [Alphaproteobacteria bacterium]|nr:hypothetical protein [Alphaproteobacteria bacterium]
MDREGLKNIGRTFAGLGLALAAANDAPAAAEPTGGFMSKDKKSIHGVRIYTDGNGNTHAGRFVYPGAPVAEAPDSIVPKGATVYFENAAAEVLIRGFPPHFTTGYHNDPAHQHQLTFTMDGYSAGGCMDGSAYELRAGDLAMVEDPVGKGHTTHDEGGTGFTVFFVAMPSGE